MVSASVYVISSMRPTAFQVALGELQEATAAAGARDRHTA